MTTDKKELAVAALRNGTVIDHIPSEALFKCVKILNLEALDCTLTIGNNLASKRCGSKGIIKVADVFFPEQVLNRIALIAPQAVVNTIRDYEVVECDNPKCITNNEPMATLFVADEDNPGFIRCHYCNHSVANSKATIL